ncbi:putative inactive receptor kinase [Vitis vinifera]|uniref:Putative inactive receptor kinase n=1 Tax=Vitis vinifera TaxID=29760 RepID=A0A438K8Q6_VITVI|nr:putative inactive receptor kinase [Vitis vinifera]
MAMRRLCVTILIFSLLQLSLCNPDFTALLAFKSSSDHFNSLSSWSNSTHPCSGSWLGVTCNNGRVTHLVLDRLNLTGSTRALARLPQLRLLSLNHNRLSSAVNLSSWPNLKHLYLSDNRFSGEFPAGVSSIRRIRRLVLSHNNFSGEIPMNKLTQLRHLLTLRLEENSFTGTLSSNSSSSSIYDFNVSGNNLAGEIPAWLSQFPLSSFARNAKLCGKPLGSMSRRRTGVHREMGGSDGAPRERNEMVMFEGCKGFSKVDDLLKASAELLGKGSVGSTYKVVMEGGGVVAVKRVREGLKRREIDGLMKEIGGLRHRNIVSLRAYYFSRDELLLVYDFLTQWKLAFSLARLQNFAGNRGPGRTPLDWTTRLKLASGAARGLAFLHGCNKSKLTHGHLTSSNIIVDTSGNACIADIGLHHFLPAQSSSSDNAYTPPELAVNHHHAKLSQKADVYSFGVVLLEILTGKMVVGEGETSLAKWVEMRQEEEWTWEVFDLSCGGIKRWSRR